MQDQIISVETEIAGRSLRLETGRLALQADGAVTIQYGETIVLCTAMMAAEGNPDADFFPLTVEYQERYYAAGKIKGSRFVKRDGRPSDEAILKGRLVDRPIRPLFPKGITNEAQIIATILSVDMVNEPGVFAITAASAASLVGGLPIDAPLTGVRIGMMGDELIVFPTLEQIEKGRLDLVVAGTPEAIVMVEAGANEVSEEKLLEALELAHSVIKTICDLQMQLKAKINPEARTYTVSKASDESLATVSEVITQADLDTVKGLHKKDVKKKTKALQEKLLAHFASQIEEGTQSKGDLLQALGKLIDEDMRKKILEKGERVDGRGVKDIRPVSCNAGLIPRTHGSALFQRGETQALTLTTLGGPGMSQIIDSMDLDVEKRYIHYYTFPPYSVGEIKQLRGQSRREIGHGALAERALIPVIPSKEEFPYTILVNSEIMTCNGSSSMASVCGSTLSLMDAGVPIKKPVSGIAMGLITSDEFKKTGQGKYVILSDIQGLEDFAGDMDFKVTGTTDGITALQMDIKVKGITLNMMREALVQAREGQTYIMGKMMEVLSTPRSELSPYAPIIFKMNIHPDKIRDLIGKGGETIQRITGECNVEIDIEQDGLVVITAPNKEALDKAIPQVKAVTYEPVVGDVFDGTVTRLMDFGAFVEFVPGKEGLVHISNMRPFRVNKVSDVVKVGDKVKVRLSQVDEQGRYNLSMKEFYTAEQGGAPASGPVSQNPGEGPF